MPKKASYIPSWAKHEKGMFVDDADKSEAAAVAFQEERTKETTNSLKARSYEEGRAKEWQKNKHEFAKESQKSKDPSLKTLEKIKNAGEFEEVIPAPGFLLVEPIVEKQKGSFYIPTNADDAPNTGIVLAFNEPTEKPANPNTVILTPPFLDLNDKVLFRKFAGIDMKVNGKQCKFLMFDDILAKVK